MATVSQTIDQHVAQALAGKGSLFRMATYSQWAPDYTSCVRSVDVGETPGNWVGELCGCDLSPVSFADSSWLGDFANHCLVYNGAGGAVDAKAAHESGGIGGTVKYATKTAPHAIVSQVIADTYVIPGTDIELCYYPAQFSGITAASVFATNWRSYLPLIHNAASAWTPFVNGVMPNGLPVAVFDQDNNVLAHWWFRTTNNFVETQRPTHNSDLNTMWQKLTTNDSSGPCCLPWRPANKLIYLGPAYSQTIEIISGVEYVTSAFSAISESYDAINAKLNEWIPGASLTPVDLSSHVNVARVHHLQLAA